MFSILSAITGYLYPGYSSYKTLAKRPAEEADLERWVMYWTVLASLLTIEHIFPLIFWIPFYSLIRFIFLLYLVLPQVQGSTYLYKVYLQPILSEHENEIDSIVERSKSRLMAEGKRWINFFWERLLSSLGMSQYQAAAMAAGQPVPPREFGEGVATPPEEAVGAAQPPTFAAPLSGTVQMLGGLWRAYGPSIVASGVAFVQNQQANIAKRSGPAVSETHTVTEGYDVEGTTSGVNARTQDSQMQSNLLRRKTGDSTEGVAPSFPVPQLPIPSGPSTPPLGTGSSSGDERDKRYDTISHEELADHEDPDRPAPPQRGGSWFPWSPSSKGYERVKSE